MNATPNQSTTQLQERLAMIHDIASQVDNYHLLYGSAFTVQMLEMFLKAAKNISDEFEESQKIWAKVKEMNL